MGPSDSAFAMRATPRWAFPGLTPSCCRRRWLPLRSCGAVRTCNSASSSVAIKCNVPRLTDVITSERSSVSARLTSEARPFVVRARIASRAPRGSCAWTASRCLVASTGPRAGGPERRCAASRAASTDPPVPGGAISPSASRSSEPTNPSLAQITGCRLSITGRRPRDGRLPRTLRDQACSFRCRLG